MNDQGKISKRVVQSVETALQNIKSMLKIDLEKMI